MGDDIMTARQFIESSWFKLLWRGVFIVGIPFLSMVSAYAGYTLNSVYSQQSTLNTEIASIKETQSDRATVNDNFQTDISSDVAAVQSKLDGVSSTMSSLQLDVARIVGMVSEMQRRDVAQSQRPAYVPGAVSPQ